MAKKKKTLKNVKKTVKKRRPKIDIEPHDKYEYDPLDPYGKDK